METTKTKLYSPYDDSYKNGISISRESMAYVLKKYGKNKKFTEPQIMLLADAKERSQLNDLYRTHEPLYASPSISISSMQHIFDCLELKIPIDNQISKRSSAQEIKEVRDVIVATHYKRNLEQQMFQNPSILRALDYIVDYFKEAYNADLTLSQFKNLQAIPLAKKKTPKYRYEIAVNVDLMDCKYREFIDGKLNYEEKYDDIDTFIDRKLSKLNYQDVTAVNEDLYRKNQLKEKNAYER